MPAPGGKDFLQADNCQAVVDSAHHVILAVRATKLRAIYQQLSPADVHGQLGRAVEQLREPFPQVAELLADAAPDILACPRKGTWWALPQSLPPKGDVVGIFPNRLSARRLVGAVLAEQHDEWAEARRYLTIPNAAGNEALAEAVVQQPAGTAEPRDKPAPQSLPPKGDVVGIFPNRLSARRLVGAVLAEQHDEWAEARRYLTIPNAAGNEALPTPNMLDAAA